MDLADGLSPDLALVAEGFGLYVHVPFCTTRCDYCAFATWTDHGDLIDRYVDALCLEIDRARQADGWRTPATVFFGGGTPSLLEIDQVSRVLEHAMPASDAEITLECNPESTDARTLLGVARAGVNRISLGVQSTKPHVLRGLGRSHEPGSVERAIDAIATSGITNFNVDLVFGGAGERAEDFAAVLDEVLDLSLRPSHLSVYALTVEPGTPLARSSARHPDDDVLAERYEQADRVLGAAGFRWYEISNWAAPGAECRHNLSCWLGGEYLGVGCSAHSHRSGERSANIVSIDRYVEAIFTGVNATARVDRLDASSRAEESLALMMRTRLGVPLASVDASVFADGLMEAQGARAVLTLRGRLLANEVAMRLVAPGPAQASRRSGTNQMTETNA